MKKLFTFLLLSLNTVYLFCQPNFTLPENARFHDISGDHFLSTRNTKYKVHVTEHAGDGTVVWTDSIGFMNSSDTITYYEFCQFGNTDQYAVVLQKLIFTIPGQDYENIFQFSKFKLSDYSFSNHFVDTFMCSHKIFPVSKNDTSLYLFVPHFGSFPNYGYETKLLTHEMDLSQFAPLDSMLYQSSPFFGKFRYYDDTLYRLSKSQYYLNINAFTSSISHINQTIEGIISMHSEKNYQYDDFIDKDSIFVFLYNYSFAFEDEKWIFNWLDNDFTILDSEIKTAPFETVNNLQANYKINSIEVFQNRIYVFARSNHQAKVMVYDFDFNLDCEISIPFPYNYKQSIAQLNNKIYFKQAPGFAHNDYFELSACSFGNLSVNDKNEDNFSVHPNPASDEIHLKVDSKHIGETYSVFNYVGKNVLNGTITSTENIFETDSLKEGMYFIQISNTGKEIKFMKIN